MSALRFLLKMPFFLFCFRGGRRILMLAFTIILLLVLFHHFGPQPFEMSPMQKKVGDDLVEKAADAFPWNNVVGSVLMISEVDAWSPFFQDAIREKVTNYKPDGSRKFDILPDSFTDRVLKALGFNNNTGDLSGEQIRRILDEEKSADTLLLVRFTSRDYVEDENTIGGHLLCTFYTKGHDGNVVNIPVSVSTEYKKATGAMARTVHYFRTMTTPHKILWGVLGVLLFPFMMAPVTLTVVRAQSAKAYGFFVFVYTVLLFLFEGLLFPAPAGILQALVMCAWGIAIVWYLLKICDMLASPGFGRRMDVHSRSNRRH